MPNSSGAPTAKSVAFFENALSSHAAVEAFFCRGDNVYVITRKAHRSMVVLLTDIYTLGIADLLDAMGSNTDLSCVVTISNWNGYTRAAKEHGVENAVGVFNFAELMGALYLDKHWTYVKQLEGKPVYAYKG